MAFSIKYYDGEQISVWHGLGMVRGCDYKRMHKGDMRADVPGVYHHLVVT